jgi:hypothetical protein
MFRVFIVHILKSKLNFSRNRRLFLAATGLPGRGFDCNRLSLTIFWPSFPSRFS